MAIRLTPKQARNLGIKNETYNKHHVSPKEDRTYNGVLFASKGEMLRWIDLKRSEDAKQIFELRRQVRITVLPQFAFRGISYTAVNLVVDYTYYDEAGNYIIEDFKGRPEKDWIIKWKLLAWMMRHETKIKLKISNKDDIKY